MTAAVVVLVGLLLVTAWAVATARHDRRRTPQTADWEGSDGKPDLWTSSARCVHCGEHGGFLELRAQTLEFECLSCGRRHARTARG